MAPTGFVADQPDQVLLWNWRLGHPSVQKLQYVVPIMSFASTLACELVKHHRATYQS